MVEFMRQAAAQRLGFGQYIFAGFFLFNVSTSFWCSRGLLDASQP